MSNNNTAVITKDTVLGNPKHLQDYLEKSKSAIAMALPKHLTPDRMLRLTLTAFSTTPALRNCTAHSILASTVLASQLGIEIGVTGQGYLIPYGKTCTFVPGWQGLVGLLNNSGRATAWTGAVFEGDEFEFELGSNPKCKHVPGENYGDPDYLIAAYACGKVNGSDMPIVECWTIKRIEKHRDRFNKVGNRHYSFQHPEMYARKVVLLQVLKYLPRSIQVDNAITVANNFENGRMSRMDDGAIIDLDPVEGEGNASLEKAAGEAAAPATRTRQPRKTAEPAKAQAPEAPAEPVSQPETPSEPVKPAPEPEKPAPAPAPQAATPAAQPSPSALDAERSRLSTELGAALKENAVTPPEFEAACKKAGILSPTDSFRTLTIDKIRSVVTASGNIIESIIAAREASGDITGSMP